MNRRDFWLPLIVTLGSAGGTAILYVVMLVATFATLETPSERCPEGSLARPALHQWLFPIVNECRFADGTRHSLAVWWFNPLLFLALAVTGALAAYTFYRWHRLSRSPR